MGISLRFPFRVSRLRGPGRGALLVASLLSASIWLGTDASAQSTSPLATRAELTAAAARAETAAATGDPSEREKNAMTAAAIRQRLRDGDLHVGDRVVVTIISDAVHRDTIVVRSERTLELPGLVIVPITGVLRSELQERVSAEVLKYVKAQQIEVTPLMRVGILGAVTRPGYFAFASDIPITDAIMAAGGPGGAADLGRTIVRRRNQEFRTAGETSRAITGGLTLDQFGLSAGDEVVVGQQRQVGVGFLLGMAGAIASVLTLYVSMSHNH